MPSAPTTEGSIVGYLRADDSDWNETLDRAEARAAELGRTNPTIKVDAKVSEAIAKIEAVEAAEKQLGDTTEDVGRRQAVAGRQQQGYWQTIMAAVLAILPMLPALTAYVAAGAGALVGMGVAGVLAVMGIKHAMQDGTATGKQFSAGLQILNNDLSTLERTAAQGVLAGFVGAVAAINAQMPYLNSEVGLLSGGLGRVGAISIIGILRGFQVLAPLLAQAQNYIGGIALGFQQWTTNGGMQSWVNDALRTFPLVATTLGDIGHAILSVLAALQPMGGGMLVILDTVARFTTLLADGLGPAFGPVAVGALTAYTVLMKWQQIGPVLVGVAKSIGLVAATTEAAAGPIGWIIGAIGILAGVLMTAADSAGEAATATADYSSAVEQDRGKIAANVQAQVASNLAKSGAIDLARKLGISVEQLTAATLTDTSARKALTEQLDKVAASSYKAINVGKAYVTVQSESGKEAQKLVDIMTGQHKALDKAIQGYQDQIEAQGVATLMTQQQVQAQGGLRTTIGLTTQQVVVATNEAKKQAVVTSWVAQQLDIENQAAQRLKNMLDLLNNSGLGVAQAQTSVGAATNAVIDALKQNGLEIEGNSKHAIANQQALQQMILAQQGLGQAVATSTGSQNAGTAAMAASKKAMEEQLSKLGLLTPAVQRYLDRFDQIPSVISQIHLLSNALNSIPSPNTVGPVAGGYAFGAGHADGGPIYRAGGGSIANYLAYGGSPVFRPQGTDTVPAMLTPGEFVVKEKSASYDPQFLKAYNQDPAAALASRGSGGGVTVQVTVTGVQQEDPRIIGRLVGQGAKQALAGVRLG